MRSGDGGDGGGGWKWLPVLGGGTSRRRGGRFGGWWREVGGVEDEERAELVGGAAETIGTATAPGVNARLEVGVVVTGEGRDGGTTLGVGSS